MAECNDSKKTNELIFHAKYLKYIQGEIPINSLDEIKQAITDDYNQSCPVYWWDPPRIPSSLALTLLLLRLSEQPLRSLKSLPLSSPHLALRVL